ncbi:MAG: hypothetical protein IJH32_04525 [Ruminococcus sp.]|nr:hypothetical protein [Ruminococcus sp.]
MKNTKRNKINQIFSAVLVIGFIICSYFFSTLATKATGLWGVLIQLLILLLFGLLLFYATRVGEGKAVKRFSLAVLLLIDLPALYIILATFIEGMPFHEQLASTTIVVYLATVGLGYAIPYTFLSGFEMIEEKDEEEVTEEETVLEGGLAEELLETEKEEAEAETAAEETAEEAPAEEKAEEEAPAEAAEEAIEEAEAEEEKTAE